MRRPLREQSVVCGERESYQVVRLLSDAGGTSLTYYARQQASGQLIVLKELYPLEMAEYAGLERAGDGMTLEMNAPSALRQARWAEYVSLFCCEGEKYRLLQSEAAKEVVGDGSASLAMDFLFFAGEPFWANGTWYIAVSTGSGACIAPDGLALCGILGRMSGLCAAIAGLHKKGFAHLDVKPDNVFITRSGQVKLLDLGSMQRAGMRRDTPSFTPGFTAPELLNPEEAASFRADVYSLGAVLFYLLTGRAPAEEDMLSMKKSPGAWASEAMKGYSVRLMKEVRDVLAASLSERPEERMEDAAALGRAIDALLNRCAGEERPASPAENPDEFVRALCEAGRLEEEFEDSSYARAYEARRIEPHLKEADGEDVLKSLQEAVRRTLYIGGEYRKSLDCLRYLEKRADLTGVNSYVRRSFYEFLVDCCDKLGDEPLKRKYASAAADGRIPRMRIAEHESRETFRRANACEHRFDFAGMLSCEKEFIEEAWAEPGMDAVGIILCQEEIDNDLAGHAGRMAEALCLCRPDGWREDAGRIFRHVAQHLTSTEGSFRALSIQNLMNFAAETGDRALFEEAVKLLPGERLLAWRGAEDLQAWAENTAMRFEGPVADGERYELYLFLKSLCALWTAEELPYMPVASLVRRLRPDGVGSGHPKELILRYAAVLAGRLPESAPVRRSMMRAYEQHLSALHSLCDEEQPGIVRLLALSSWLEASRELMDKAYCLEVRRRLEEDIRAGVMQGVFEAAHFSDALADGTEERLLDLFRFWHR